MLLSIVGRRTLIKQVLSSLPTHISPVLPLPKSVSNHMEAVMRNFFWSGGSPNKRRHQISWDMVTLPTKEGGLGIRHIHEQNQASFIKLGCIVMSSNSLWSKWMACRYFPNSTIWSPSSVKSGPVSGKISGNWRIISTLAAAGLLQMASPSTSG